MDDTDENDEIKQLVLQEEEERKRSKVREAKKQRSVRFSDFEEVHEFGSEENDGPIKEHLLQEVYERRQKHAFHQDGEQENVMQNKFEAQDGASIEQDAEYMSLDGEEVSAFNMKEEQEEGYDVETGEITRRKNEDDEANDPWLQSLQHEERQQQETEDGGTVAKIRRYQVTVSASVREQLEKQQRQLSESKPLSDSEIAAARSRLVQHLNPRESVMQGLARLSSKIKTSSSLTKARDRVGSKRALQVAHGDTALIDSLTDAATSLLSVDADAFELKREEIEHALRISGVTSQQPVPSGVETNALHQREVPRTESQDHTNFKTLGYNNTDCQTQDCVRKFFTGVISADMSGDDSGDDMFADSDDDQGGNEPKNVVNNGCQDSEQPPTSHLASRQAQAQGDTTSGQGTPAGHTGRVSTAATPSLANSCTVTNAPAMCRLEEEASTVDYESWPIAELKRVLDEAHVNYVGATEKEELATKCRELDRKRASSEAQTIPLGFVLDPSSGYYIHSDTGWYYHAESRCYYQNGKWYSMDGKGVLQEYS